MFIRQHIFSTVTSIGIMLVFVFCAPAVFAQSRLDSTKVLNKIVVTTNKKLNPFATAVPVQLLNNATLQQINAASVADAAKYFSGVLIKDYGGVGGLKTISVRSLGALNTGILYDGIPVADAQSGQVDLSKFSSTFVQTLELDEANPQQILLPARAYSSASVLAITTNSFNTLNFTQEKWKAGIKQGSFGLWQPFAGIYFPTGKNIIISANAEVTLSKGNYPYYINNGSFSENAIRINSDVKSLQGEFNIVKQFSDSATLQTKIWTYNSERGLPGSIIFFNNISVQRLWDNDFFAQSRYEKKLSAKTALLLSVKYSNLFTKYIDPNFGGGSGLDDRYTQQEIYGSAALSHHFGKYLSASLASDIATTNLIANIKNFSNPTRLSLWNSIAMQYSRALWQINGSLLNTNINEQTQIGPAAVSKNKFTPTIAASYKINVKSPFLFRAFYKNIFRFPTFNDVYYTYIGSINPKLLPEYSNQYDGGITYSKNYNGRLKQFNFSIDGYYNSVRDKIISVPNGINSLIWTSTNLGEVHITGVDVDAELNGNISSAIKGSARIAYTWQQALDVTDPSSSEYKNEIPYTPQNSGSAIIVAFYKEWSAGYNFLFSGTRYSLEENNASDELPGWGTHDLFITRSIKCSSLNISVKAEVDNVFNDRYEVIQYYPMPGRQYKISITFNNL
jgi:vitamin B12 transporter